MYIIIMVNKQLTRRGMNWSLILATVRTRSEWAKDEARKATLNDRSLTRQNPYVKVLWSNWRRYPISNVVTATHSVLQPLRGKYYWADLESSAAITTDLLCGRSWVDLFIGILAIMVPGKNLWVHKITTNHHTNFLKVNQDKIGKNAFCKG